MKTLITVLSLTALATSSVMAQTPKVKAIHGDAGDWSTLVAHPVGIEIERAPL